MTRYHWFVFTVAALGWVFDCLDQQLFNLARAPAMKELLTQGADPNLYGAYATMIFLIGWATGGIAFGIMGDRVGRAKTMMMTILIYSIFTGFSSFSRGFWDFSAYRFLTGLGVGGEFAVGVALVAEVMPDRARPFALGLLQALSALGNITAAFISIALGHLEEAGFVGQFELFGVKLTGWRIMFLVGTLPALLAIVIRRRLKEPERWQAAVEQGAAGKTLGSFTELFGDPRWRKRALMGMVLASAGVIGLWGIGFFSIDLNRAVFRRFYDRQARESGEA
ncbi:MAG TPA: MFS transporter, partial [Pirellulales bacterium]|nr:MFS transporter [Pirellulales bacterium]